MSVRKLSLLAGVGAPAPVPADVTAALGRVEIVAALGERGSFRLTFRLDRGSTLPARFLPASGDLVRVVLLTEECGEQVVAMDGVAVTHAVAAGAEDGELVVGGEDLTLLMGLRDGSGRPFPGMTAAARVAVILAGYSVFGVTAAVVPPPLVEVPEPSAPVLQHGTDYAYLQALARGVGYRFTLDPGPAPGASVAHWGPEPRGDRSQPALLVRFGRRSNVETLELRFDAMGRVAPQAVVLDPATKVAIPIPVPDIAALAPPLGAVVPPAHRQRRLPGAAKLTAVQAAGALLAEAARSAEATTGLGTLKIVQGQRRLRPGQIVEVRGAADPFDGLYAVRRVRDTLTARSHHQEFELVRAGLGAAGGGKP